MLYKQAIAFGALSKYLFSVGRIYQWAVLALPLGLLVPIPLYLIYRRWPSHGFDHVVTPVICWYIGSLCLALFRHRLLSILCSNMLSRIVCEVQLHPHGCDQWKHGAIGFCYDICSPRRYWNGEHPSSNHYNSNVIRSKAASDYAESQ